MSATCVCPSHPQALAQLRQAALGGSIGCEARRGVAVRAWGHGRDEGGVSQDKSRLKPSSSQRFAPHQDEELHQNKRCDTSPTAPSQKPWPPGFSVQASAAHHTGYLFSVRTPQLNKAAKTRQHSRPPAPSMLKMWPPLGWSRITRIASLQPATQSRGKGTTLDEKNQRIASLQPTTQRVAGAAVPSALAVCSGK